MGSYVHESVHASDNEDNNAEIRNWAPKVTNVEKDCLSHHEVLTRGNGFDLDRDIKIIALINYGLRFRLSKGYTPNRPICFMLRETVAKTAQLVHFAEVLYKLTEEENDPGSDKHLVGPSEQPTSALHTGE
ncbi:hypothetical protein KC357_g8976 [Hortaea werneckii]|nr:hypothetical protein KC357_g8976 [Hortaea werneckii]